MGAIRRCCTTLLLTAALTFPTITSGLGCSTDEPLDRFREASAEELSNGLKSLVAGLVDGFAALYVPESDSASDAADVDDGT